MADGHDTAFVLSHDWGSNFLKPQKHLGAEKALKADKMFNRPRNGAAQ
jgi:hypothetical protein